MDIYIWKINDIEFELDMEDAETNEKYQNALETLKNTSLPTKKDKDFSAAKYIRAYCQAFRNLYDNIFGDGSSEKIFIGIKDNTRLYDEVYANFLEFVSAQTKECENRTNKIKLKYAPKYSEK